MYNVYIPPLNLLLKFLVVFYDICWFVLFLQNSELDSWSVYFVDRFIDKDII